MTEDMKKQMPQPTRRFFALLIAAALITALILQLSKPAPEKPRAISLDKTFMQAQQGKIISIEHRALEFEATIVLKGGSKRLLTLAGQSGNEALQTLATCRSTAGVTVPDCAPIEKYKVNVDAGSSVGLGDRLYGLLPTLIIVALLIWFLAKMRPGGAPAKGHIHPTEISGITFDDVAGCEEAITELGEVLDYLKEPERFTKLGAKVPKGILLHGPPGTGKTLLARALASEAAVPFYSVNGSEFVEMYVGVGASRIRKLFASIQKHKTSAIVFIDELDAVGGKRSAGGSGHGGALEHEQTLNALLTAMDGFTPSEHPIVVIAATNRLDSLDPALVRPGRFDRRIPVDAPDRKGRERILNVHGQGKALAGDVDLSDIARQTSGMTGADLAGMFNEAALIAARSRKETIDHSDLEAAIMRVVAGPAREHRRYSDHERHVVAAHEAGHAIVGEQMDSGHRVEKVSIIPRGQSGGQTLSSPEEERHLYSRKALVARIALLMAGRAAEQIVFDEVTTGAQHDLEEATKLALAMVMKLGMTEGVMSLRVELEGAPLSDEVRREREAQVEEILQDGYTQALEMLTEGRALLDAVTEALLEHETIDRKLFLQTIGKRPDPAPARGRKGVLQGITPSEPLVIAPGPSGPSET